MADFNDRLWTVEEMSKFERQGAVIGGTREVYRSVLAAQLTGPPAAAPTLFHLFHTAVAINPTSPAFGSRDTSQPGMPFVWLSYGDARTRVKLIADGMLGLVAGCGPPSVSLKAPRNASQNTSKTHTVGIYAVNRPEWHLAEFAAYHHSLITVALYDTLGPETVEFIVTHADLPLVFTTIDKVHNILAVAHKCPKLKIIVSFDAISATPGSPGAILSAWAATRGVRLISLADVEALGAANPLQNRIPVADDICTICYTSGTTGNPKGALLTHGNITSCIRAGKIQAINFNTDDVYFSYLPLSHVYEKLVSTFAISCGARVGYWRGDVLNLLDDLAVLRPTIFPSVPRLFNRIHDKILQGTVHSGSVIKAALFRKALESKIQNLKKTGSPHHTLWDALVFRKVQAVLGGRVRFMMSASAPLSPDIMTFLRVVFGCQIVEAYGQTETAGGGTMTWASDMTSGHVGPVFNSCELMLKTVEDMNYTVNDKPYPRGEICFRGNNIFKGYYKDEKKTEETFTEDGWLMTGDIGFIDNKGRVTIIDRKKSLFKLAQGEYISPEKIENVYTKSPFISQMFVHGDSLQSELVGIAVPDAEISIPWAKQHGLLPSSIPNPTSQQPGQPAPQGLADLCKMEKFKQAVLESMSKVSKENDLRGFEFVKLITLEPQMFSIESNLLTPTMKLKRQEAVKKYRPEIDQMYKQLASLPKTIDKSRL